MSREFPDGFADVLTSPKLSFDDNGAEAPEDQRTVNRMVSSSHKKMQVFQSLAVIVILMGTAWPSTGNTRSGQPLKESGVFSRRSSIGLRAGLTPARSVRPIKPDSNLC
jgi:hypothetical protein